MEPRAGWDATFSTPKSVSLTALVGGDERVREAHRESVRPAIGEIEHYTQARIGNVHVLETTVKFAPRPSSTRGFMDVERNGLENIVAARRTHDVRRLIYVTFLRISPDRQAHGCARRQFLSHRGAGSYARVKPALAR